MACATQAGRADGLWNRRVEPDRTAIGSAQADRVVHADVVGYSRLIGLDDIGTRRLRREVIDPEIDANGGRIVNTSGDACSWCSTASMAPWGARSECKSRSLSLMARRHPTGLSDFASASTSAMSFRMVLT
jgi:hypothetical protein